MKRTDIINALVNKYNYNTYLEIGVRHLEDNFNHINCIDKIGVDPLKSKSQYPSNVEAY